MLYSGDYQMFMPPVAVLNGKWKGCSIIHILYQKNLAKSRLGHGSSKDNIAMTKNGSKRHTGH
jgi:hypothetical protein